MAWCERGVAQAWRKRGAKVAQIEKNRFGWKNRKVNREMCKRGVSVGQTWCKRGKIWRKRGKNLAQAWGKPGASLAQKWHKRGAKGG